MLSVLGVGFVAYSPLGRGFLASRFRSADELDESDFRRDYPRVAQAHLEHNLSLVARLEEIARGLGARPGQVALAWLLAKGDDIVPIPGTKRRTYLEENVAAAELTLDSGVLQQLEDDFPIGAAAGERYPDWAQEWLDHGSPSAATRS